MSTTDETLRKKMQYHRALSNIYCEFAYSYYADKGVDWSEVQYNVEFLLTTLDNRRTVKQLYELHKEDYPKFQGEMLDRFELSENDEDLCLIEAMGLEIVERYLKFKYLGVNTHA